MLPTLKTGIHMLHMDDIFHFIMAFVYLHNMEIKNGDDDNYIPDKDEAESGDYDAIKEETSQRKRQRDALLYNYAVTKNYYSSSIGRSIDLNRLLFCSVKARSSALISSLCSSAWS